MFVLKNHLSLVLRMLLGYYYLTICDPQRQFTPWNLVPLCKGFPFFFVLKSQVEILIISTRLSYAYSSRNELPLVRAWVFL